MSKTNRIKKEPTEPVTIRLRSRDLRNFEAYALMQGLSRSKYLELRLTDSLPEGTEEGAPLAMLATLMSIRESVRLSGLDLALLERLENLLIAFARNVRAVTTT